MLTFPFPFRWKNRWHQGKIGWHRSKVNGDLEKYFESHLLPQDNNAAPSRVLVPLAGKTIDMSFLANHRRVSQVIGVEGIRKALQEFAAENPDLQLMEDSSPPPEGPYHFRAWTGKSILLLQGDFFELDSNALGGEQVDAIWDRAALVAIDPTLREKYVDTLRKVLRRPGGRILLNTYVKYSGDMNKGPPFSIDEDEVRRLFEGLPWVQSVELLEVHSASEHDRKWYERIFIWLKFGKVDEKLFLITTK